MLLLSRDAAYDLHDTGRGHPERPARLDAVAQGIEAAVPADAIVELEPRVATRAELERVHDAEYLDALERFCEGGGGSIDPDTVASRGSWEAALHAAGSGLRAVDALTGGEGKVAFCAVRPPGHHATPSRSMGFCLLNNVAVTAAALAARDERVAIIDWDAHHGNGTQEMFWDDPAVLYASLHEYPLYPGTGRLEETGGKAAAGLTCNLPLPAGATGDVYLEALDEVVLPLVESFAPGWTLISAGFDAHQADPLTGLHLSAGDFALFAQRLVTLTPGRVVAFLEGGYDLAAVRDSVIGALSGLLPEVRTQSPERPTGGGPGRPVIEAARRLREAGDGALSGGGTG